MKKIALLLATALACSSYAFAADGITTWNPDYRTGVITVGGTISGTELNNLVSIEVKKDDPGRSTVFVRTYPTGENGSFTANVGMPADASGDYTMYIRSYGSTDALERDFPYINPTERGEVLVAFNKENPDDIVDAIRTYTVNKNILNIDIDIYNMLTSDSLMSIANHIIAQRPAIVGDIGGYTEINDIIEDINEKIGYEAFSCANTAEKTKKVFEVYGSTYEINSTNLKLYEDYSNFTEVEKAFLYGVLANYSATNNAGIYKAINEGVILTKIENAASPDAILKLLTKV